MSLYRKKPVVIEAFLFDGTNGGELHEFCPPLSWNPVYSEAYIPTLEGMMTAKAGDWIIKGVKGEFYPCKPDIFAATYELVTDRTVEKGRESK